MHRPGWWIGPLLVAALALWPAARAVAQETGRVTGRVLDGATGQPITGAQIAVVGTTTGTTTDARGRYLLANVPPGRHTISVREIGYRQKTAEVSIEAGLTVTADFQLYAQAIELEGVVVTGTAGQARRREIGNSIGVISGDDLEAVPIVDVADVLQGRAAGIIVRDQGTQAGAGSAIILRGVNTLGSINPLIYVDGVRLEAGNHGDPDEANVVATALDDIDARSIERVEVVRGAAATTLYGTEAAAGVIQIFTKTGSRGTPQWTLSVDQGVSTMGHVGPDEDPTGLHLNDCSMDPGCPASGSWFRTGHFQAYRLSVRGGGDLAYYVTGGWTSQAGVIDPQGAKSWSVRGNFSFVPLDNLTVRFNNMFTRRDITWIPNGNNAEGFLLNVMRGQSDYTPAHNDSLILEMKLDQQIDHFVTGANITWTPVSTMTHRLNVGMDYSTSDYTEERPWGYWSEPAGDRENDQDTDRNFTVDYAGTWNIGLPLRDFTSGFSWGFQYYDEYSWGVNGFGERFAGPGSKLITSGVETEVFEEEWVRTASGGFFLQETVGWRDRLFVTFGGRWDGFSTFGDDFGMAVYPKVAAAYTISDHDFWPSWWEVMKLRAALGESGRAPAPFAKDRTWASVSGDTRQPGVILSEYGNPEVGPERTREIETGFEGSMFDGRVSFDVTYFSQKTRDALIRIQRPPSIGTEQRILTNLGEVTNKGFEVTANVAVLRRPEVSWEVGGNIAAAKNEVAKLGNVDDPRRLGRPVDALFGDVVINGDEVGVDPIFEERYLGHAIPSRTWGINTRLVLFQRLALDVLGEGQGGHVHEASIGRQNVVREFWAPCNYVFEAIDAGNTSGLTARDRALCDPDEVTYGMWTTPADFFKLRSVSLSYRVPERFVPGAFSGLTVRLQGRNLLTITDYPGLDPELAEGGANRRYGDFEYYDAPPPRQFLLNVTVNF
ncbi:MAG: TonB-dependent receptor domain-containing protein [Gemmatimonadales bacterium]